MSELRLISSLSQMHSRPFKTATIIMNLYFIRSFDLLPDISRVHNSIYKLKTA
jgi:hypothetical protein